MTEQSIIRAASKTDLDALVKLEAKGFLEEDQFSREQLRYLITEANATTFIAEQAGNVKGSAIMLWRKNSMVGRLYSIVVSPKAQGQGLGGKLLQTCEDVASRKGCEYLSLEVRVDNERAIAFYRRHDYEVEETIPNFYADGASALQMTKLLPYRGTPEVNFDIPHYAQTSEFTCGPACLIMAMKYLDPDFVVRRSTEFMIWKEATLIFMMGDIGGCGPFGLAVSALRRGYTARVVISDQKTPFLSSVRSEEKKEVIRLVHDQMKYEARELGVIEEYYNFRFEDIVEAMNEGMVPIVLISTYRLHKARVPHWVVVTGYDSQNVYFHDPYDGFYIHNSAAQHYRISIPEFQKMRGYGKQAQKSVVFVGLPKDDDYA